MNYHKYNLIELTERSGTIYKYSDLYYVLKGIPDLEPDGPWLAGGCLRRLLIKPSEDNSAGDFDFFFKSQDQMVRFTKDIENRGFTRVRNTDSSEMWTGSIIKNPATGSKIENIKVNIVYIRYYGSLIDVIDNFDYTICQIGFDGNDLAIGEYTLWDIARKRLVPHKITYAVSSIRRMLKYQRQGFYICSGGIQYILDEVVQNPGIINSEFEYID